MPYRFTWYPTPLDGAVLTLTPDGGGPLVGSATTDDNGRPCHICQVPDATANGHGAQLDQAAPGFLPQRLRGILTLDGATMKAALGVDDCTLHAEPSEPAPGPTPPPQTGGSPLDIITRVYNDTHPNLATVPGCGKFTEDCCDALHEQHSPGWGHISKTEGQNQFNGHAVDALQLVIPVSDASGNTNPGIYDIIYSSASFEAKPVFNYVEPAKPELWYYPADAPTRGVTIVAIPRLDRR
jgi:hypothetical protein